MTLDKLKSVLAIDTVGRAGALAFIGGESTEVVEWDMHVSHTIQLPKAIEQFTSCSIDDVQGICVSAGPGGFSSIRTGLAFAKGLCASRGISMVVVSTLEALALAKPLEGPVTVLCSAGRGTVYSQSFVVGEGEARPLDKPTIGSKDNIQMHFGEEEHSVVVGDDQVLVDCNSTIDHHSVLRPSLEQRVLSLCRIGQSRYIHCESDAWIEAEPIYVRPLDVTKPRSGWST